ncbi:hypothetical protein SHIRM173S_01713 [Streptomyces hirsutus]
MVLSASDIGNRPRFSRFGTDEPLAKPQRAVEGWWRMGNNTSWAGSEFRTTSGPVRGRRPVDGVVAVLGVPYAAAPFGPRRFREPQPVHGWSGPRDCTVFGPVAPQSAELPGSPRWREEDEDVLTVNVWVRRQPDGGPLPVLFWIHGGAYTFGSSAQPDFDGTALARAGVVVVSCNYRVGFEGFGHVPGFPDNRGLLDQVAALRWVRENIAAFGGDPGNVTVAGHSAGAGSVACLMAVEQARGLFRRAVAHSVPHGFLTVEAAATTSSRIAAEAGAERVRSARVHRRTSIPCRQRGPVDPREGLRDALAGEIPLDGHGVRRRRRDPGAWQPKRALGSEFGHWFDSHARPTLPMLPQ